MSRSSKGSERDQRIRLKGVTELPNCHGLSRFRAAVGVGQATGKRKGNQTNLGLYPTQWMAAFAYNVAIEAMRGELRRRNEIPREYQPDADQVRWITARVRARLGLGPLAEAVERPPSASQLLTLLEVTIVGFWRGQVVAHSAALRDELDLAAARLVEAARLLLSGRERAGLSLRDAFATILGRRVDQAFRRSDVTRQLLADVEDDVQEMARWLVFPDQLPGGDGFLETLTRVYLPRDHEGENGSTPGGHAWAAVLGVAPPFSRDQVRAAFRARSKEFHPDVGGDPGAFIRLLSAYEQAQHYCETRGV